MGGFTFLFRATQTGTAFAFAVWGDRRCRQTPVAFLTATRIYRCPCPACLIAYSYLHLLSPATIIGHRGRIFQPYSSFQA